MFILNAVIWLEMKKLMLMILLFVPEVGLVPDVAVVPDVFVDVNSSVDVAI